MELSFSELNNLHQALGLLAQNKVRPFSAAIQVGDNLDIVENKLKKITAEIETIQKDFFECNEDGSLKSGEKQELSWQKDADKEAYAKVYKELMDSKFPVQLVIMEEKHIKNTYEGTADTITPAALKFLKLLYTSKKEA